MIRILVADDHALIREGLRAALSNEDDLVVCDAVGDGEAAVLSYAELAPDVVLMDLTMPLLDGLEATRRILARDPSATVLVVSAHSEQRAVRAALAAGASGYVLKGVAATDLAEAVRAVRRGETVLMPADLAGLAG